MLNANLVEQVAALHRHRKSGVLTVVGNGFRLRFCFQDGDPVALDFGTSKDAILTRTLVDFHKIGTELHQYLLTAISAGQDVTTIVRQQQAASEDEILAMTRSMVEDTLCRCFGTMHYETVFADDEDSSTFDFDRTSVRLRIGTGILLSTVQERVTEIDRITKAIGGGKAVFALAESEAGSVQLGEYEKLVLNYVDGHRSIEDIAISFRESVLNISRLVAAMVEKGVLRRSTGSTTPVAGSEQVHMAAAASSEGPPATPATPAARPFRSVLALGGILVAVIGLAILVMLGNQRNSAVESDVGAFNASLANRHLKQAEADLAQARQHAGNDARALRQVDDLAQVFKRVLLTEEHGISEAIAQEDFDSAQTRLQDLPSSDQQLELSRNLSKAQEAFRRTTQDRRNAVSVLLDQGKIAEAMALIAAAPEAERSSAMEPLQRWRLLGIERASSTFGMPLNQRMALLDQVMLAHPDAHELEEAQRIRADFDRLQQHALVQIAALRKRVAQGEYAEAANESDRLQLRQQFSGSALASQVDALQHDLDSVRDSLTSLYGHAVDLITDSESASDQLACADAIHAALQRFPLASDSADLTRAAQLLGDVAGLIGDRTAGEEALAIEAWRQEHQPPAEVSQLLVQRGARLRGTEVAASEALDNGRIFLSEHDWDAAQRAFEAVLARPQWQRTSAHSAASLEMEHLKRQRAQQQAWQDDLTKAMLAHDIDECYRLQEKMGLKYLPLLVCSRPPAHLWRDGKEVGMTPLQLDIPAGERSGLMLDLRLPDFHTATIDAGTAQAGWLLQVDLDHESSMSADLAMTVTSPPCVVGGRLWVANREQAVALGTDGKMEHIIFEPNGGVDNASQPLYSTPLGNDGCVYYATREGLALKYGAHGVERIPLTSGTDFPPALFASQVVTARRLLIVASQDGVLHASNEGDAMSAWNGTGGAPFMLAPRLCGERVFTVRQDGLLEAYQAEDGKPAGSFQLGEAVVACWATAQGLGGLTADASWSWDGQTPVKEPLPQTATSGGEDVFLTIDHHVFLRCAGARSWQDVGQVDGKLSGLPLRWGDQAVLPLGRTLVVLGSHGFRASAAADFLTPARFGDQLAVATANGQVRCFPP